MVKLPHPYLLEGPQAAEIRRRFGVEARAASRVSHPNVVTIYMVGETADGIPAIAMEFVEGEALCTRLKLAAPLPLAELGALGKQLGEALRALHEVGIVHRDLAPSNVIVCTRSRELSVTLLDFGVAKLLDAPNKTLGPMGTPGYLAPEQLQGQVTPRTDVYSLGAILWWALTGYERPDDYSDGTLLRRLGSPLGPDPLQVRPDAPRRLAEVVSRMLIPAYERRLSVEGFLDEWRAALDATLAEQSEPGFAARTRRQSRTSSVGVEAVTAPAASQSRTVAVVVGNSVLRALTTSYLQREGDIAVVACDVRELTRSNPGAYAAAVLDADLPGVDVGELVQMLAECYEELAVVVIGSAEQGGAHWMRAGASAFVQLPEQLDELRAEVARALGRRQTTGTSSSGRLSTPMIERLYDAGQLHAALDGFIGEVPQWLADVNLSLTNGELARASGICQRLVLSADSLGLTDLARLARATCAFIMDADLDGASGLTAALEDEYEKVFPEVYALMQCSRPAGVRP
ncbi:Serine/threonine protein kinase [Enhygromyxa salina]|uniref:Serine/threonine protein kinase n=1 Tax=Enhygromyxa salina TaxID=215803 RepID=A0A0C2DAH4_9BACT|nr:Serine/threonine protein kinase [Enhygromyxa salina]